MVLHEYCSDTWAALSDIEKEQNLIFFSIFKLLCGVFGSIIPWNNFSGKRERERIS